MRKLRNKLRYLKKADIFFAIALPFNILYFFFVGLYELNYGNPYTGLLGIILFMLTIPMIDFVYSEMADRIRVKREIHKDILKNSY